MWKLRSVEGKRHVQTALLKLWSLENSLHKSHVDEKFVHALIRYLEEMTGPLGQEECTFYSRGYQPLNIDWNTCGTQKRAASIMLPDHDFIVGFQNC